MATIALSRSRHRVAICLVGVSAGLLVLGATVTLGFAGISDVFALVVVIFTVLVAVSGLAAVALVRPAPKLSRMLILVALAGSVVVQLVGGLLPGVPVFLLAIAAGLMYLSPWEPASGRESGLIRDHDGWVVALGRLSIVLHVTVALLYVVAAWVTPFFGPVLFLWGIWVGLWSALLLLACRLLRTRPIWTPLAPLVAVGLWFGVVSLQAALGWLP